MNQVHSSSSITPRERYIQDSCKIKYIKPEDLDNHFLHRVSRRVNNDATIKLYNMSFEVPQKYIGQKINIRYSPVNLDIAYIFDNNNILTNTIYPLKKIDNSKVKRNALDYTKLNGGGNNV
jgi:putative transposase